MATLLLFGNEHCLICIMQLRAPKELVALMSSLRKGSEPDKNDVSKMVHHFEQPVPVASYLIAIVVGNLVSRSVWYCYNSFILKHIDCFLLFKQFWKISH